MYICSLIKKSEFMPAKSSEPQPAENNSYVRRIIHTVSCPMLLQDTLNTVQAGNFLIFKK